MKQGIAFCGVCGIASVGVLTALSELGMEFHSIFISDNSILPVCLYASGLSRDTVIQKCRKLRGTKSIKKKDVARLNRELHHLFPAPKLYVFTGTGDYTNQRECFPKAEDISGNRVFVKKMISEYIAERKPSVKAPETWPLTCMGSERILLVSPYCCKVDSKCHLHIRLPAYDRKAMSDLRLSFFQGYRAAIHRQKKIYEELLF